MGVCADSVCSTSVVQGTPTSSSETLPVFFSLSLFLYLYHLGGRCEGNELPPHSSTVAGDFFFFGVAAAVSLYARARHRLSALLRHCVLSHGDAKEGVKESGRVGECAVMRRDDKQRDT